MAFATALQLEPVCASMVQDEKFVEIYPTDEKRIRLLNNGQTATNIKMGFHSCVLGRHSYSSGIHRIRMSIDKGQPTLGIRSRNIPPLPNENAWGQYGEDPLTYGWNCVGSCLNGHPSQYTERNIMSGPGVYTLTLNCDARRLSIVNESTEAQDEIEVDITCASFPWCLFIALSR